MAIRDIFDDDKRSKEQLRAELADTEGRLLAAEKQLDDLRSKSVTVNLRVVELDTALADANAKLAAASDGLNTRLQDSDAFVASLRLKEEEVIRQQDRLSQLAAEQEAEANRSQLRWKRLQNFQGTLTDWSEKLRLERDQLDAHSKALSAAQAGVQSQLAGLKRDASEIGHLKAAIANREQQVKDAWTQYYKRQAELSAREAEIIQHERLLKPKLDDLRLEEVRVDSKLKLVGRSEDVDVRSRSLDAREVDLRRREAKQQSLHDEVIDARRLIAERGAELKSLASQLKKALNDQDALNSVALEAVARAERVDLKSKERGKILRSLRLELKKPFQLRIDSSELLQWLADLHAAAVVADVGGRIVTIGSSPWDETQFDEVMEACGLEPQVLDEEAHEFEVFIVGGESVDFEALRVALDRRQDGGLPVRLYSQELWILYLMTGFDPLEIPPDILREAFAAEHPVLATFLEEPWVWPNIAPRGGGGGDPPPPPERGASPLHLFGYHVGIGTKAEDRHDKLSKFLKCSSLTPFFDEESHDKAYQDSWGKGGSSVRLRRMGWHLHWLAGFQGADQRKEVACRHWRQDLNWMKKALAPSIRGSFHWPS